MSDFRSALVVGATGFIGSALARRLAGEGVKTYCLARPDSDRDGITGVDGIELIETSTFKTSSLIKALAGLEIDIVFNLASYGVSEKDRDPDLMVSGNIGVVSSLLQAVGGWRATRFIHAGSCSEYGPSPQHGLISEDAPIAPLSMYGAAKAASVLYGNALASRLNVPFVVLRLFGVYGVGEGPQRLLPYIIDHLLRDEPVDLTSGLQTRDLLYVDDAVDAFIAAGRADDVFSRNVYNVCSSRPVQIRSVAEIVPQVMGKPAGLLDFGKRPSRGDEADRVVGDNRRFRQATDWELRTDLTEGIEKMLVDRRERG